MSFNRNDDPDEYDYDNADKFILAKVIIVFGIFLLIVTGFIVVSHYFYHVPAYRKNAPGFASAASVAFSVVMFAFGGTSMIFLGLHILRQR